MRTLPEIHLGERVKAGEVEQVHQHGDLHAVARHERHPVQHLPPAGGFPGERLHEAGEIGPEQVDQRPGEQLRDAAAAVRLGVPCRAPLLPGREQLAFVDIDAMQKRVYGRRTQGAASGHTKIQGKSLLVRGLNALAATISTPLGAPVIAAVRLRGGNANSARGAARFAAEAIRTARDTGCSGLVIVRADSAYYSAAFCGAVRRAGARFSVTVNMDSKVTAAIAAISQDAWTGIRYPRAIWDDRLGCWVSDAQVAETGYTAFTSAKKGQQLTARLIVRRVRDLNCQAPAGQDELFPAWRYHAVFTDSPVELVQAEGQHRDHAVAEQVFADWTDGPLAHLPSGSFPANAAWLACAAIAHNLLRAAGSLASLAYGKARGATIRRDLIDVAARTARHGHGHITLHLPEAWHREHEWLNLFAAACGPPPTAA